jgi:hypothetical protein
MLPLDSVAVPRASQCQSCKSLSTLYSEDHDVPRGHLQQS